MSDLTSEMTLFTWPLQADCTVNVMGRNFSYACPGCPKHLKSLKWTGRYGTHCNGALTSVEIFEKLNGGLVEGVAKLEGDAELQQLRGFADGFHDCVLHAVPQVLAVQLKI